MKKLVVLLTISIMTFSLVACGKNTTSQNNQDGVAVEDSDSQNAQEQEETAATPATILRTDFREKMESGDYTKTEDLANALLTNKVIPFAGATMPVEPGYLNGFTEEIKGFSEATMFGPSIGSIPFIGYIFKVEDDKDEFMLNLIDKADLRWNVCTQADEKVCETVDDMVFFVMSPANFEE